MKKSILILVAALGCTTLVAQTNDQIIIPGQAPVQPSTDTTSQPSLGSNVLEIVTPAGIEILSPQGTEIMPATACPPATNNQPGKAPAPVTPDSNKKNTEGTYNATPNVPVPQNPTQ